MRRSQGSRIVSLDSSPYFDSSSYVRRGDAPRINSDEDEYDPMAFRSQSAAERVMQPLPFNRVQEDIQHPLSSKRSCSEFNDFGCFPTDTKAKQKNHKSKSLWKKLFSSGSSRKSKRNSDLSHFESFSSISSTSPFMESVTEHNRLYQKNHYKSSIREEVGVALDFVFGYNSKHGEPPMEIELKNLKNTENSLSRVDSSRGDFDNLGTALSRNNSIRSTRSGRSSRSNSFIRTSRSNSTAASDQDTDDDAASMSSMSSLGYNYPSQFRYMSFSCWRDYLCFNFENYTLWFRRYCIPGDNDFFYNLQIQPFSSGIYLRGMLAAGSNNLLFHTYTLLFLPAEIKPFWTPNDSGWFDYERIMVTLLVLQVALNFIVAPVRIILHYECWQTTRAYDTDRASHALQDLIQTNMWLLNRILAWALDLLGVAVMLVGEVYLFTRTSSSPLACLFPSSSEASSVSGIVVEMDAQEGAAGLGLPLTSPGSVEYGKDPLSSLIVEMCATNILSFFLRALVCLLYYLSIADPEVLNGKRRRKGGLSKFDLDLMPTFVFADSDEVVNNECSICLNNFEMGEMLISLPCHQRHSFHANCIREWLQHDAKCPLCQKGI
jgi:hypothetical protein